MIRGNVTLEILRTATVVAVMIATPALYSQTPQRGATATLSVSATIATSVSVEIPSGVPPQIVVANDSDPAGTFASLGRSEGAAASRLGQNRRLPAMDIEKSSSVIFKVPMTAAQSESTNAIQEVTNDTGHRLVLKTTTIVSK
jgi:hypothetical protein